MGILPVIKAARLIPILVRAGFRIVRQVGSHVHLEHVMDRTRKVTIPMHPKPLTKKTLFEMILYLWTTSMLIRFKMVYLPYISERR